MKLHRLLASAALPALAATLSFSAVASAETIRVQSTTDTVDAGLVPGLLGPAFKAAFPNDELSYTGVGTGAALQNARDGKADVVITHAPSLETQFVNDGFSLDAGYAIFYSDYVLLGPQSDPAGVLAAAPHDAISALEKIAAAGAAGHATFLSRGENSGTNVQEQLMWGLTNVPRQLALNASGNAARAEPIAGDTSTTDTGHPYPTWYAKTSKGQAANVQEAGACNTATYPNGGCYTMTDRGTFNRLVNEGTLTTLKVVADKNTPTARGGENLLINRFSAYVVNPAKFPADSAPNPAAGQRFVDFLVSPAFQAAINTWPSASDPAFRADAVPAVALTTPLPQVADPGSTIAADVTVTDKLPGGGNVSGIAAQLQSSTDGGKTFVNTGTPVSTDAAGHASLRAVLPSATTSYRVALPRFRQFTAGTVDLGVVAATVPPVAAPAKDTVAPVISKPALTRRKISFTLSEGSTVKVTIKRRVEKVTRRNGKRKVTVSYRTTKTFTVKATKAGTASRTFKTITAGRYRVTLAATDAAGNKHTRTAAFTVKKTKAKTATKG